MIKKIVPFIIALCFIAISALPVVGKQSGQKAESPTSLDYKNDSGSDSAVIFPVKKTSAVTASEIETPHPMDLPDPTNVKSSVVYDPVSGLYFFYTRVGNMRMFLTNFEDSTFLRFGTLNLVKGDWRTYTQRLYTTSGAPASSGTLDVGAVNIEEDGNRIPVNYVLPPGVTRQVDPSQPQIRQENEQSITLKVNNLAPNDARAVYKSTNYDMAIIRSLYRNY